LSEVSRDVLFARAIDLVTKQGDYVEQWTARQVTVQAGLAAAVGIVVAWKGLPPQRLVAAVVLLLAVLAIVLGVVITGVIRRHLAWQSGLVTSVKLIEGDTPLVFRSDMLPATAPRVRVADFHMWTMYALCGGWFVVACAALWFTINGA
jgi:hypothetical protein